MSTTTPILSQSNAVGQGFNVFGKADISGLIMPLMDPDKAGTRNFTFLGNTFLVPSYITPVENTSAYYSGGTYSAREQFQASVSAHVGAGITYGLFSGEMAADFSAQFMTNDQYYYSYQNFYSQLAYLSLAIDPTKLTDNFLAAVEALPSTVTSSNLGAFTAFFNEYGVYYTQKIVLGGMMKYDVAVKKSSNLTTAQISTMMSAQYNALVSSGSVDASVKSSAEWQAYVSNSSVTISAMGGDPAKAAALASVDPNNPSPSSVSAYDAWLQSIASDPAICDFTLSGIWELCGAKQAAVQQAWEIYGGVIHPRLTVQTSCRIINQGSTAPAVPPVIILGSQIKPTTPPAGPCGFQAVVMAANDLTDPHAVLFDKYYAISPQTTPYWGSSYGEMWDQMVNDIAGHYNQAGNVFILATFGFDGNMPPTSGAAALLQTAGAGSGLKTWLNSCDPGSMQGNATAWVSYPTNYILVGTFGRGPGTGVDSFSYASQSGGTSEVDVFFYQQSYGGQYTLGPAS